MTNGGATAAEGWRVTFTFANGQQITQYWRATVAQAGSTVTATNVTWNGALAAGASTTFGFLAFWNNSANAVPAASCVLS